MRTTQRKRSFKPTKKPNLRTNVRGCSSSKPQTKPFRLPEATEDECESLKASIAAHGVILPVIQNSDGTIIDGETKKRICDELKIKHVPTEVLHVDAQTADQLRRELNLCRKHTSLEGRRELARLRLVEAPTQSDRTISRLTGLSHRTVAGIREGLVVRGQIVQVTIRKGKDGKTYSKFPKVRAKTKKEVEKAVALLEELGDDAPAREMELRSAKRRLRDVRKERQEVQPPLSCDDVQILHSDFRKLDLADRSVDLMFTDPLYTRKSLPLYSDLSKFAARVLKPGGILMAYAGTNHLNEVFRRLDEHLNYLWTCILINDECSMPCFQRGFFSGHRPVLCYTNGTSKWYAKGRVEKPEDYVRDTFKRGPKEKSLYVYQQPVDEAIYYVGKLTKPGDLIVDCFGGSFTTAEAVHHIGGRRFIGCDIDETCVAMGRKRLAALMGAHSTKGSTDHSSNGEHQRRQRLRRS